MVERKEQWDELVRFIEEETSFLTAPASAKFHLCRENGLLEHSVNVAEHLLKRKGLLAQEISDESCVVAALLHDLVYLSVPVRSLYPAGARFSVYGRGGTGYNLS